MTYDDLLDNPNSTEAVAASERAVGLIRAALQDPAHLDVALESRLRFADDDLAALVVGLIDVGVWLANLIAMAQGVDAGDREALRLRAAYHAGEIFRVLQAWPTDDGDGGGGGGPDDPLQPSGGGAPVLMGART